MNVHMTLPSWTGCASGPGAVIKRHTCPRHGLSARKNKSFSLVFIALSKARNIMLARAQVYPVAYKKRIACRTESEDRGPTAN